MKKKKKTAHCWYLKINEEELKEAFFSKFPAYSRKTYNLPDNEGGRVSVIRVGGYWDIFNFIFKHRRTYLFWNDLTIYVRRSSRGRLTRWPTRP